MRTLLALLVDLLVVAGFTVVMRLSHSQPLTAAGLWETAWPFGLGLGIGWLVTRSWRGTLTCWAALGVWACTAGVGLLARRLSLTGAQPSVFLVACWVLAVFLLGWRLLAHLTLEVRRRGLVGAERTSGSAGRTGASATRS